MVRAVSAVVAALSVAGITWTYGDGTLTLTGLTAWNVAVLVWEIAKQALFQHGSFRLFFPTKTED